MTLADMRQLAFAKFGSEAFEWFWNDGEPRDLDGGYAQEMAVAAGLLARRTEAHADIPCGDGCDWTEGEPLYECDCLFPVFGCAVRQCVVLGFDSPEAEKGSET